MALWKDIMDSQKQKIFIFQVAEPFIRFFGVYSFTQWHRASPFYLPLLEICFTVSASLVPLATKGGRSGGRTAGIRRAIAPTAPRWIGEGFFQRGSVVAVVKSSQRASLDVKSQVTQQPSLTHGVFCLLEMSGSEITSWYTNVHKKWNPEEFQLRNLEGIWGSPCSASKWVFQIFPRGRLYSRRWRHHEWQKMWDFNLTAKHIDLFLRIFSKPSHHIQVSLSNSFWYPLTQCWVHSPIVQWSDSDTTPWKNTRNE